MMVPVASSWRNNPKLMCLLVTPLLEMTDVIVFCADPRLVSSLTLISAPGEAIMDSEPVVRPTDAGSEVGGRPCPSLSLDEDARVDLGGVFVLVPCFIVDGLLETGTQL